MQKMGFWFSMLLIIGGTWASSFDHNERYALSDELLREIFAKMDPSDYFKYEKQRRVECFAGKRRGRFQLSMRLLACKYGSDVPKEYQKDLRIPQDYDIIPDTQETMIRDQEYLQHSSLWGHQNVAGGSGEGKQRLGPGGHIMNMNEVKTDVLPAYCDPPNPCPVGYTAADGCLSEFVNSAAFSREYQSAQKCMCDTEHMFDCPKSTRQDEINALSRSIDNEGLNNAAIDKILQQMHGIEGQHRTLVAKKHHLAEDKNPYLQGEKLPIVAKKGSHIAM